MNHLLEFLKRKFLITFFRSKLLKKFNIVLARQEIIEALLIARRNSDRIQIIKNGSRCPSCQLMMEFGFNENQADAIAEIKKNINEIEEIKILEEKENLENQRIELEQILNC